MGKAGPAMYCVQGCTGSGGQSALWCPSAEQAGAKISGEWVLDSYLDASIQTETLCSQLSNSLILGLILCCWVWSDLCTKAQLTQTWRSRTKRGAIRMVRSQIKVLGFFSLCRIITGWFVTEQPQLRHISPTLPTAWSHSNVQNHHCRHLNTGRQHYSWAFNPNAALLECFISRL